MAREKYCQSYHGSGQKISNNCCPSKTKVFNIAKVKKVETLESEKANAQSLLKIMIKNIQNNINKKADTRKRVKV